MKSLKRKFSIFLILELCLIQLIGNSLTNPNTTNSFKLKQNSSSTNKNQTEVNQNIKGNQNKTDYFKIFGPCSKQICKGPYGYCVNKIECEYNKILIVVV